MQSKVEPEYPFKLLLSKQIGSLTQMVVWSTLKLAVGFIPIPIGDHEPLLGTHPLAALKAAVKKVASGHGVLYKYV